MIWVAKEMSEMMKQTTVISALAHISGIPSVLIPLGVCLSHRTRSSMKQAAWATWGDSVVLKHTAW